jgi:hypothetical protein
MSESAVSLLITSTIIVVLALFVPCLESLVRLVIRAVEPELDPTYKRDAA